MRRLLALRLSVALMAVAAGAIGLADVSASAARPSSRVIVCPLAASGIIPCCGPPVTQPASTSSVRPRLCCPGNALCVIPVTINSAPNPSTASARVTISGRVFGSTPAGSPLVLWQRLPGRRTFHRVRQATTGAGGQFTIPRGAGTVQTNRDWYVTAGGLRSRTLSQRVQAVVTLAISRSGTAPGGAVTLSGHVSRVITT